MGKSSTQFTNVLLNLDNIEVVLTKSLVQHVQDKKANLKCWKQNLQAEVQWFIHETDGK